MGLLRMNSKKTASTSSLLDGTRPPNKGSRPSSLFLESTSSRLSFGLPKLSSDPSKPMFEFLGLSPTQSRTMGEERSASDPQHSPRSLEPATISNGNINAGLGLGEIDPLNRVPPPSNTSSSSRVGTPPRTRENVVDAAEGWKNEKVLYQCACVADL